MEFIDRGDGVSIATISAPGSGPAVLFLPGWGSTMDGTKIMALSAGLARAGVASVRMDYSGCGRSGGRVEDGTIGRWRDDALAVIDRATSGKLVLFGSSMGGWIALLLAMLRPERVAGIVGVAAAPDFTERLLAALPAQYRRQVMEDGRLVAPDWFGPAMPVTRALIEDGRRHLLLGGPIAVSCPVRLAGGRPGGGGAPRAVRGRGGRGPGRGDAEVPWQTALTIAERVASDDVRVTLIKDGDHRLSRPGDIAVLGGVLAGS